MRAFDATGGRWKHVLHFALVLVIAAQLLGIVSAALTNNIEFDGGMNLEVAKSIANGEGPHGAYHHALFYPAGVQTKEPFYLLAAAVFKVAGVGPVQAQATNVIFMFALVLLVVAVFTRAVDLLAGLLAACFMLAMPRMAFYGLSGYGEIPTLCFGLGALAVIAWPGRLDTTDWRRPLLAGVLAALAFATKVVGIVQLVAVAMVLLVRVAVDAPPGTLVRAWIRACAAFAVGVLLPLSLIEAWRWHWLGTDGYAAWWKLQLSRIGSQSGATPRAPRAQGVDDVIARLGVLAHDFQRLPRTAAGLLALPLLSAGFVLLRRRAWPPAEEAPRFWLVLGLALVAGVYIPWWLGIVPADKVWVRYFYIALLSLAMLAGLGMTTHVRALVHRSGSPVSRAVQGAIAVALALVFIPFVWRSLPRQLDVSPNVEVQAVRYAARVVNALPKDRMVFGYGWYAGPVIQLYSDRNFKDLTDWPIGRLTGKPAYLVADRQSFIVGFVEPVLARYPHRRLMRENNYAQVYEIDFAHPNDPFADTDQSGVLSTVDFAKVDYPFTSGYQPYDPMGGRQASTDSEVLLRYEGQPALTFSAYMGLPRFYLLPEPLRGRVVVEGCPARPFQFEGTGWQVFRLPLHCTPPHANLRVRILLDNVFDLPDENVRQAGILIRQIGFSD